MNELKECLKNVEIMIELEERSFIKSCLESVKRDLEAIINMKKEEL